MNKLWQYLQQLGILKRDKQPDIAAECVRFRSDQAYLQYLDEARHSIALQLYSLGVEDVEKFRKLKRCQLALDGLDDFIDTAITSEIMKNRATPD